MKMLSDATATAIVDLIKAEMGEVVTTLVIVDGASVDAVVKAYNEAKGPTFTVPPILHQVVNAGWENDTADAVLSMIFDGSLEGETLAEHSGRRARSN